jgi:hypothetical protein
MLVLTAAFCSFLVTNCSFVEKYEQIPSRRRLAVTAIRVIKTRLLLIPKSHHSTKQFPYTLKHGLACCPALGPKPVAGSLVHILEGWTATLGVRSRA